MCQQGLIVFIRILVMNQTYVMYKWKGNDMNFHGDYAVSYVEHQDHLFKICRSHTLELLQSNSDLQIRQAVELKLGLGATLYQWTDISLSFSIVN